MSKIKINKSSIEKIKREGKEKYYFDTELNGFGIRKYKNGYSYMVVKRLKETGKVIQHTIGAVGVLTPEEAREEALKIIQDIRKGKNPKVAKETTRLKNITLKQVFDEYIANKRLAEHTLYDYKQYIKTTFKDWQDMPMASIMRDMVLKKFLDKKKTAPHHATRQFTVLGALFNYVMDTYIDIISDNPCRVLKGKKERINPRQRYLEESEIAKLWQVLEVREGDIEQIRIAKYKYKLDLFLGGRRNEISSLQRKNINFDDNKITFLHTKNGRPLVLPITEYVRSFLEELCEGLKADDYLFSLSANRNMYIKDSRKAFGIIWRQSGLEYFTMHDLRRTVETTHLIKLGTPFYIVQKILNHTPQDVDTKHYTVITDGDLRKYMQRYEDYILKICRQRTDNVVPFTAVAA